MIALFESGRRDPVRHAIPRITLTADVYSFVDGDGESVHGDGYQPVGDDGEPTFGFRELDFGDATDGARACKVAGTSYRSHEIQSDEFAPGRRLRLVPDPANPYDSTAIQVRTSDGSLMAGFIPHAIAAEIAPRFGRDGPWEAMSLWEWRTASRGRIGMRVLIAPRLDVGVATAIIRSES